MKKGLSRGFLSLLYVFVSGVTLAAVKTPLPPVSVTADIVSAAEKNEIDRAGGVPGIFRVSEAGAATYSIPIEAPRGTGGVTPSVALAYSSSAGTGLLGQGWSISGVKGIIRCRQTLSSDKTANALTFTEEDRFCLGGQRLMLMSGTKYGAIGATYRLEMDDFSVISSHGGIEGSPDYFSITTKDGATSTYGAPGGASSVESEEGVRNSSGQEINTTLQWALNIYKDNIGNKIDYNYHNDIDGFAIANINYSYSNPSTKNSQIIFIYDNGLSRSDQYVYGFKRSLKKRLKKVSVHNKSENSWGLLHYYRVSYDDSGRLPTAVSKCTSGNICKGATEFQWTPEPEALFSTQPNIHHRVDGNHERFYNGHQYADINGDGRLDLMWLMTNYDNDGELRDLSYINILSKSNQHGEPDGYEMPKTAFFKTWKGGTPWEWKLIDYNGDGRADFATFSHDIKRWMIYLSRYNSANNSWAIDSSANPIITNISHGNTVFQDVNSDGLMDAVSYVARKSGQVDFIKYYFMEVNGGSQESEYRYNFKDPVSLPISAGHKDGYHHIGPFNGQSGDFNGDGKLDAVYLQSNTTIKSKPSGIGSPYPIPNSKEFRTRSTVYFSLGDIDGNGQEDIFKSFYFGEKKSYGYIASRAEKPQNKIISGLTVGDLNNDGYSDIVAAALVSDTNTMQWYVRFSNGVAFSEPVFFKDTGMSVSSFNKRVDAYSPVLVDMNGDGYSDFVWHDIDQNKFKINYWVPGSNNFQAQSVWFADSPQGSLKDRFEILDMNGDGAPDLAYIDADGRKYISIYFNEIVSQTIPVINRIENGGGSVTKIDYGAASVDGHYLSRNISNANGLDSNCAIRKNGVFASLCGELISLNENDFYGDLYSKNIFNLASDEHSFGLDANRDGVPDPVFMLNSMGNVVKSVSSKSPAGSDEDGLPRRVNAESYSKVSYFYADAKYQAMGRGWLGFGALITRDEQSKVVTTTRYRSDFPFVGSPIRTEVATAQGNILSTSESNWRLHQWNGGMHNDTAQYSLATYQPYIYKSIEKQFSLVRTGNSQGKLLKKVITETGGDFSGNGNIPSVKVTTTSGVGSSDVFTTKTNNTYGASTYEKRFGRLKEVVVNHQRSGSAPVIRRSSFTYYPSGKHKGMLKTETLEKGSVFERTNEFTYDNFGNRIKTKFIAVSPENSSAKHVRCDVATKTFDNTGRYIYIARDCLGRKLTEVVKRDKFGSPRRIRRFIDAQGVNFFEEYYAYTNGGIEYFKSDDSGSFQVTTITQCPGGCGINAAFYTRRWGGGNKHSPTRVELAREYMDVLGRPIKKVTRDMSGKWVHKDIEYDPLGRVQRQSLPYFAGKSPAGWTTMTYDILGRVIKLVYPDNTSRSTTYNGLVTTFTNALGQVKIETRNARGELVGVEDNLGAKLHYDYDAQGNLKTTRHDNSTQDRSDDAVIAIDYDILGRKISMNDPDKGNWRYQYNAFGELETQTNAKGQTITTYYDGLGRRISREDRLASGQLAGKTNWAYDGHNGMGQSSHVSDSISGYVKVVEYDSLGRPSKTVTSLGVDGEFGNHYEKVTYDQYGRVYQVFDAARNDDNYTDNGIEYRYNEYGYQHQTVDAVYSNGDTRQVYRTITKTDVFGNIIGETLGNGVVARQKEYGDQTGRLKVLQASNSNKLVQRLEYNWNAIGNVNLTHDTGRGGASNPRNRLTVYDYDSLNRLTSTQWKDNGSVIRTDSVNYFPNGNIKTKSGIGTYSYDQSCGCGPHAVTQAGNTRYQYDANGNMVRDSSGRKIAYTIFDKAYRMERGSTQVSFAYDTSRKRYLRTDTDSAGTQTTLYIGSVEKITHKDGSKQWKRYIGGNLMILQDVSGAGAITQSHTRYLLTDHLGSLQYILDAGGFVIQSLGFDPWGDRLNAFQNEGSKPWATDLYNILETTRGFTGHEMVDGLDIVHMNGRIYDSRLGRFLQADPIIDGAGNTQGYNRYSYGKNNPLNGVDPSGHDFWKETFDDVLGFTESPVLSSAVTIAGCWAAPAACPAIAGGISGATTYAATGNLGMALKSGIIAGVSAYAFQQIGEYFSDAGLFNSMTSQFSWGAGGYVNGFGQSLHSFGGKMLTSGQIIGQISAHAITGGVTASLQGGKFGHGFISAGFTKGVMGGAGMDYGNVVSRTTVAALVGGDGFVSFRREIRKWCRYGGVGSCTKSRNFL